MHRQGLASLKCHGISFIVGPLRHRVNRPIRVGAQKHIWDSSAMLGMVALWSVYSIFILLRLARETMALRTVARR